MIKNTDWVTRYGRRLSGAALACACMGWITAATPIEETRSAVNQWVEVESTLSSEAIAWEEKKGLLDDLIAVAVADIEGMKKQLAAADAAADTTEARRAELVAEREENVALGSTVRSFLTRVESRVKALIPRLPAVLREKLDSQMQRLPQDSENTKVGIAARMQTVMGIVAEIQRFDMRVSTGKEVVTASDGSQREIETLHIGLGAAYYVTADGGDAGTGASTAEGWAWRSVPALAPTIREAIALASGEVMEARFLSLPVSTQGETR